MEECKHFRALASAELDGEITEEERAALHAHLAQCPDCAQWAAAFSLLHKELPLLAEEPPAELRSRVKKSISLLSKKQPSLFSRFKFTAAAAVVVAILFAASVPIQKYLPQENSTAPQDAEAPHAELADVPAVFSGSEPAQDNSEAKSPASDAADTPQTNSEAEKSAPTTAETPDSRTGASGQDRAAASPAAPSAPANDAPTPISGADVESAPISDAPGEPVLHAGSASGGESAAPVIPYDETFLFVLALYHCEAPAALAGETAELLDGAYYYIIDPAKKDALLSEAEANDLSQALFPGTEGAAHALVILYP